jgi:hypothetical protein
MLRREMGGRKKAAYFPVYPSPGLSLKERRIDG